MSACLSDVIRAVSLLAGVYPTDLAVSALKRLSADDILDLFARVQQATESRSTALLRVPGADAAVVRRALGDLPAAVRQVPATLEERFFELTQQTSAEAAA